MTRRALALFFCCLPLFSAVHADDTEIFGISGVKPNVLILLDSSGSMNDPIDGTRKIDIAKQVVTNLIGSVDTVRFGVMKFRSHGGLVVSPIGTDAATMITAVNAISLTSVGTPLGDQLFDAGKYYEGLLAGYASPIQFECQLNFVIMVSDGLQNSTNVDVRDAATARFTEDHSSTLPGSQHVVVHTIGFGIDPGDAAAANDILQEAAANGGGNFSSADNYADLEADLLTAIQSVVAASYSFAAPLLPSTSTSGSDKAFQAAFATDSLRPFWRGSLSAFQRGSNGRVPTDVDGVPLVSSLVWEAGEQLRLKSAASRTIFTAVGGAKQTFTTANGVITPALLGVATASERDDIIDFVRGIDAFDEDGDSNTTEQREWKLGDIMHSSPVLVSRPPLISGDAAYQTFRTAQAGRTSVLVVGANDGMLHGFRASDGEELWAFIPPDLLPKLEDLTPAIAPRSYFVDSSPVAADIKISGSYKTVILFGERRGGRSYHALDVTDTTNPGILWSFTDAKLGETWSVPAVGRIRMWDGSIKHVAFLGGGYDTAANNATGKVFFVVDLATGQKLWEYYNDGSTDDRQYLNYSLAASPTAVDLNGDGYVDRVYTGDVGGQLWKFDVSSAATLTGGLVDNWSGKRLFAAVPAQSNPPPAGAWEPAQAVYGAPTLARDEFGALWVCFGTGDLNRPSSASQNRFYGLKDTTNMVNGSHLSEGSLVDVTSTSGSGGSGWYFRLANDEKALHAARVFDGIVWFTTFLPTGAATCTGGAGSAQLYAVALDSGDEAMNWATGERLASGAPGSRSTVVGTGIPSAPAVVTTQSDGILETSIVTGTTDEQLASTSAPSVVLREILYWREVF